MAGKNILLFVTGSIAAVKTTRYKNEPGLVEELLARDFNVRTCVTNAAIENNFTDPALIERLTGNKIILEKNLEEIDKVLNSSDLLLVSPATASFGAQLANGSSRLGRMMEASRLPKYIAPAMNIRMWLHPATQRNFRNLKEADWNIIGPAQGDLACGENGHGRLADVSAIADIVSGKGDFPTALADSPLLPEYSGAPLRKLLILIAGRDGNTIETARKLSEKYRLCIAASPEVLDENDIMTLEKLGDGIIYTRHYQTDSQGMEHINLSRRNDAVVILFPGNDFIDDMLLGSAGTFLNDIYLATDKPVFLITDPILGKTSQNMLENDGVITRNNLY